MPKRLHKSNNHEIEDTKFGPEKSNYNGKLPFLQLYQGVSSSNYVLGTPKITCFHQII